MDKGQDLGSDELRCAAESQAQGFVGRALAPELRSIDWDAVKRVAGQPQGACRIENSFGLGFKPTAESHQNEDRWTIKVASGRLCLMF